MPPPAARDSRPPLWFWAALPVVLAAWLRWRGIGGPEAFVDEAGNILASLDPRARAIIDPLGQGRPALSWLFWPAGWFPTQVLSAARLMSAGAGVATMAALGWTLHRVAGRTAMLCGLWLWAVMPFAVFHERLALQDPFVTALLAWSVALLIAGSRSEQDQGGPWFFGAGILFGIAGLFKISAVLALPWLGLLYAGAQIHYARPIFSRRIAFIALGAVVPLLGLGLDLPLLGQQSAHFNSLPSFSADNYWASVWQRLQVWCGWYAGYGGWPLGLLGVGALGLVGRTKSPLALAAVVGFGMSVLVAALFYNRPFARYVLPDHLPLILFLALVWGGALAAANRLRLAALVGLALALMRWGYVARQIGTDPVQAAVPADEIEQYFTGPWSGRGLHEVRDFLTGYADRQKMRCLVLTHRFLRPGCYGLMLEELGDPRIGVVPFTVYEPAELAATLPGLRHAGAGGHVAYFLLYEGSLYPAHPWLDRADGPARRVYRVPRGAGEAFTLYQFEP